MFDIEIDTSDVERAWNEAIAKVDDGIRRGVKLGVEEGAAQARTSHAFQNHTGALERSIQGRVETSTRGGAVGVIEAKRPYASFVEGGTAPHEIRPKNGKALHWQAGGADHFAAKVQHPGTAAKPFMGPALQKAERVILREVEIGVAEAQKIMERD